MPFKLRLKKSRQYNVVSKSLFVICIELLDSSSTEVTLSAESSGRECLENVCQRLGLAQTELFGLRYVAKNGSPRWIELERPLKRQLDKHAKDNGLYLRVMYYVSGIGLIVDEMTRYHFFLQLKNDIIEGRIQCNLDEAVLLASYCMQAEFGNYNSERHTLAYLKDFALFPKDLVENGHSGLLERLTDAVIQQHSSLVGLSQGTAEEYYILAAQQLEGYGQETFLVKDEHGLETILAVTLKGILVSGPNRSKFYRWEEIANVLNHKKNFGIETSSADDHIVNFVFPDVESAKYVFRMCVHQHTFFMTYEATEEEAEGGDGRASGGGRGLFQHVDSALLSSREELDDPPPPHAVAAGSMKNLLHVSSTTIQNSREELNQMNGNPPERAVSSLDLVDGNHQDRDRLRSLLPSYRPAPDYETAIQHKYNPQVVPTDPLYSSQPEIHSFPDVTQHYGLHTISTPDLEQQMLMLHVFKSPPPYPISNSTPDLASQSTPDLAVSSPLNIHVTHSHNFINPQVSGSSPDLVSSRSLHQYGNMSNMHYPETHRTYTNLANILQQQQQQQSHLFEDKAMMYHYLNNNNSEANNMLMQYLKNKTNLDVSNRRLAAGGARLTPATHEPIYENVPLPWQETTKAAPNTTPSAGAKSNNINEQIPNSATAAPNATVAKSKTINAKTNIVQRTNSAEAVPSSRKSSSNSNKILEEIAKSAELTPGMTRTHERLSGEAKTIIEINENVRNINEINLNVMTKPNEEQIRLLSDSPKKAEMFDVPLVNSELLKGKTRGSDTSSNVSNSVSSRQPVNHSDVVDGKNVMSISIGKTNESEATYTGDKVAKSVKIVDKPVVQMLNTSHSSSERSHTSSQVNRILQTSSLHAYTNPALDSSNMSSDSTVSGVSGTSTNVSASGSTNSNTAEKKKKKWAGFLSGGGSSSKSKTSSLPRFDEKKSKPPVISKEAMCQMLEKKLSDQALFFEFEKIPKIPKTNADFSSAQHPDNASRNRFKEILPYEENRVRLSAKRDNKHGYINASHITATVGSEQRFYIAAQSPLPNTVENFWEMVWEANVYLVINLVEANSTSESVVDYMPVKANKIIDVGEFRITKELSQETGHCVTSKLTLSHLSSKRHRSVWHLTYTNWNVTNNTPNSVSHFLGFLEEISSIREHVVTEIPIGHNRNPPSLVHCSDGVEKTGVTILCDLLLDMLDHNQNVEVPKILLSLRHQRMRLTSNVVQYSFLHSLLVYYLKHSRLI